jgi:adenosine deaminase
VEDEPTLRLLAERGICCDVALSSNECLTVYRDIKAHPIRRLIAAGVPVTLGSDDPPFFGTSLNREYARAHQEVGLSVEELWRINLNGLRHALVDEATRDRLARVFAEKGGALGLYTSASPEERS